MKIKMKTAAACADYVLHVGQIVDLPELLAKSFIDGGYAEVCDAKKEAQQVITVADEDLSEVEHRESEEAEGDYTDPAPKKRGRPSKKTFEKSQPVSEEDLDDKVIDTYLED